MLAPFSYHLPSYLKVYLSILRVDKMIFAVDAPIVHDVCKINVHVSKRFLQEESIFIVKASII